MSLHTEKEMESAQPQQSNKSQHRKTTTTALLILNCFILFLGNTGGPLLLRLYFQRGGNRKWLSSWLETAGWPVILVPLFFSYLNRRKFEGSDAKIIFITPRLFIACCAIGLLTGLDDYMYAYGSSYLPVSTLSLLISSHLAFTAIFAFLLVKQKFSPYSINSVALLTVGAIVLGLHTNGDRPKNESDFKYFSGFFMILGAAALYGAVMPLIELTYMKAKQAVTYTLILEMQVVLSFVATAFCTVGMLLDNDFKVIPREAREYELGAVKYYVILVWSAIFWELFFVGVVGVISYSSSLLAGVIIAAGLPITEVLAVLFLHEKFSAEKGISLALSLWGFASYLYGERKKIKKEKKETLAAQSS